MPELYDRTPPPLPTPPVRFGPASRWAALAAAAAAVVYAGTLRCGFVIDDVRQIVDNDWVTGVRHLPEVFASGVWDFEGRVSSYYRPLMYVWYMAIHALAGKTPWAFHLGSVLLHAATTALVTLVASRLLDDGAPGPRFLPAPLAAGLLFALHPIHTEPVAWIAGVCDVGFALFAVAAVWLWITARGGTWERVAGAAACALASALFKEPGVTTVAVLAAYDLFARRERIAPRGLALRYAAVGAALAVYLALRIHALGSFAPTAGGDPMDFATWARSVLVLASRYVEALLVPVGLSFWHVFVPPPSLLTRDAVLAAAVIAGAAGVAWVAARASRPAAFAIALVAIPLVPAFHLGALNQGVENAFTERYLYLPSAGFALLAALAYRSVASRGARAEWAALSTVVIVATLYASGTVLRVPAWSNHLALWSDAVAKSPSSAAARMNYGFALLAAGRKDEGTAALRSAAAQQPELVDRELAKGAAFLTHGIPRKAIFAFHAALAMKPDLAAAHFGLGVAYEAVGWTDAAIAEYGTTIALEPANAEAHNNLGVLEAQRGDTGRALTHFAAAVQLRPDDASYRANLEKARGGE